MSPALGFAGYVLWLAAFPMSGSLLDGRADLFWFLLPHAGALFLLARYCKPKLFDTLGRLGVVLTVGFTWLFPLLPVPTAALLVLIGLSAAPLSVRAGVLLKTAASPLRAATAGLVLGNLLVLPLQWLGVQPLGYTLAGLALLPLALGAVPRAVISGDAKGLFVYLGFVFVFQLVSGLMYGFLYPAYARTAWWPGSELVFYMLGAGLAALLLSRGRRDPALILGVISAMAAFVLLIYGGSERFVNPSMYAMMGAAGVVDLFLLGYVLSFQNTLRAYGYGAGVLCAGIAGGRLLGVGIGDAGELVGLAGSIALNLSVLTLYLLGRRRPAPAPQAAAPDFPVLPPALASRLSDQECSVLRGVARRRTYKQVAHELGISESSVKTYMHRIYEKSGVSNKRQLLARLQGEGRSRQDP